MRTPGFGGKAMAMVAVLALPALAVGMQGFGTQVAQGPLPANDPPPQGTPLTRDQLRALVDQFDDPTLAGGQAPPRVAKWLSEDVFLFLQFDSANPASATELRYLGLGLRTRFCLETQPDRSWPHFHRWVAPQYGLGHGTLPAAEGFWLTWLSFQANMPGIQYDFSPTIPMACAGLRNVQPPLQPPGDPATAEELAAIAALLTSEPFQGGQLAPYDALWVNAETFLWLERDGSLLRSAGMGIRGTFCQEAQPTTDFTRFQRWNAPTWADGKGGAPGAQGYWLARFGTGLDMVGIDRRFDPTPPPACGA